MKLITYMIRNGLDDRSVGQLVGVDRTTINRIRRGTQLPSWKLMLSFKTMSSGKVLPNDFLPPENNV